MFLSSASACGCDGLILNNSDMTPYLAISLKLIILKVYRTLWYSTQCKLGVEQWWTNVGSQYSAGAREAARQIEYPTYRAKLAACDIQWPL